MNSVNIKTLVSFTMAGFLSLHVWAQTAETVKLEWVPVPEAKKYEVEIVNQQSKSKKLFSQKVETASVTAPLTAGQYSYRVRTLLVGDEAGPWSDYLDFAVNASSIKIIEPKNLSEFEMAKWSKPIKLNWEAAAADGKYKVTITGPLGTKDYQTNSPELEWKPMTTGKYTWKAGYSNGESEVWTEPSILVVKKNKIESVPKPVAQADTPVVNEPGSFSKLFQKSSFDLKVWLGPVYSFYSGRYVDETNSTTASTLSEIYGLSVLMRNKESAEISGLTLGADVTLKRQQMVRTTSALPSLIFSAAYHWNTVGWHSAVYVGSGLKTVGLFIIDNAGNYASDNVTRAGAMMGLLTETQISPQISVGAGISGGLDTGGGSSLINGSFNPSPSTELNVSASMQKSDRKWSLNLGLKNEFLSWSAADGSTSSLNNSMAALTLGVSL